MPHVLDRMNNPWGHPDKYQSIPVVTIEKKDKYSNAKLRHIERLLMQYDPELPDKVERTFKQWNLIIRDYLRNETALRLSVGDDMQSVPVRVVSGLPRPFEAAIDDPEELLMLLRRPLFVNTAVGLNFVKEYFDLLSNQRRVKPVMTTSDEVHRVEMFLDKIIQGIEEVNLYKQISSIDEDILGAYFFRIPLIHLYWMVIGTIAAMLDVAVEGLTIVVTAHELAHAYSHLGRDIDGERWDERKFADTDLRVVEGLAQFYTQVICEKINNRVPSALEAYRRLLTLQPEQYTVHKTWIPDTKAAGEIIRVSMIECRSQYITNYDDFLKVVERHSTNITRPPVKKQRLKKNDIGF